MSPPRPSLFGLFKNLKGEFRTFIRQEIDLAKTEVSEKVSMIGKNSVSIAVGGFVAYAGLIVLLIGLGWLLGFAFTKAGLDPAMANFLGLAIIGLVIAGIGGALIAKGLSAFKKESIAPKRTLHTLQELKGGEKISVPEPDDKKEKDEFKFSSEELEDQVEQTEYQMGQTLDELGQRLSPRYINAQIKGRLQRNPYRAGGVALAIGVVSGLLLRRKMNHA
jgi:ElaB/YqjD/DUF883 family membrane-anchored ribosome-binding protein